MDNELVRGGGLRPEEVLIRDELHRTTQGIRSKADGDDPLVELHPLHEVDGDIAESRAEPRQLQGHAVDEEADLCAENGVGGEELGLGVKVGNELDENKGFGDIGRVWRGSVRRDIRTAKSNGWDLAL